MSIRTYFENIALAIKEKNTDVVTVTPAQMPDAILSIPTGGGLETIAKADWDALTTAQKQRYGLIGIIENITGYDRGVIVNGADYVDATTEELLLKQNLLNASVTMDLNNMTFTSVEVANIDLSAINCVGLYTDQNRGTNANFDVQVGAIFLNDGTNDLTWGSVVGYGSKKNITNSSEGIQQLFRNSYTGGNKWLVRRNSSLQVYPSWGLVYFNDSIDCTAYDKWLMYTANDGSERDPISYGIILGQYNNGSLKFRIYDYGSGRTGTTTRNALAYTGEITEV